MKQQISLSIAAGLGMIVSSLLMKQLPLISLELITTGIALMAYSYFVMNARGIVVSTFLVFTAISSPVLAAALFVPLVLFPTERRCGGNRV